MELVTDSHVLFYTHVKPREIYHMAFCVLIFTKDIILYISPSEVVLLSLFIYWKRENEQGRGTEREREGERFPGRLRTISAEPKGGSWTHEPQNHDLSQNQELDT